MISGEIGLRSYWCDIETVNLSVVLFYFKFSSILVPLIASDIYIYICLVIIEALTKRLGFLFWS